MAADKIDMGTLSGNEMTQSAILGHLITNPVFFNQSCKKIQPNWFRNAYHSRIYQFLLNEFAATGLHPATLAEFKIWKDWDSLDRKEKVATERVMESAIENAKSIRIEMFKDGLTSWLHTKIYQEALVTAAAAFNKGDNSGVTAQFEYASRAVRETTFDDGKEVSFTNLKTTIRKSKESRGETLSTGLRLLDRALIDLTEEEQQARKDALDKGLVPPEEPGGLQLGDTTVLLAPTNGGKTTTLITIARHNVWAGKAVLWFTHEGDPDDLRMKMICSMMGVSRAALYGMYETAEGTAKIAYVENLLTANLKYVPYNRAGMTIEEVIPVIRRYQEERIALTGKGFDLLVVDYPAKLSTERAAKGNLAMRSVHEIVYENYVQLALEYRFHSLLAIQTNREGSKVNRGAHNERGGTDHRLLTMEDVAEAWGVMTSATNVITLNRSPQAQAANRMTFYVAKSRSSRTGIAVVSSTRFEASITHSNFLNATSYEGTKTMEESVDALMSNYNHQKIPLDVVVKAK